MISIIKHIIENDFIIHCEKCGKEDVGRNICEKITGEDSSSNKILETLAQIIEIGNNDDLIKFIDQHFSLPLGLKHNLIRLLCQIPEQKPLEQFERQTVSTLFDQNRYLTYLLRVWKDGMISPDALFSHINEMVVEERLSFLEAQKLIELILSEGGYTRHPLHGRSQIKSAMCHLLEISTYSCNKFGMEVYTHSGSYCEVLPGQMHRSDIYSTAARCTSSTTEFWWEHIGEMDRLDFIIPISIKAPLGTENKAHASHRCAQDKPTLLIGDSIKLHEVIVEIGRVIMVDSFSKSYDNGILRFAILLEGFMTPGPGHSLWGGSATAMQTSGLFDCYRDGDTEVPSPRTHGLGSSSSVDSNEDELQYSLPPFETKPRYILVFVVVQEAVALVECVCSLNEHILHDQLPTSVRYIAQGLAVVSGSNGLLGSVKLCAPCCTAAISELKPGGGRQPVPCMGGLRTSFSWYTLVEDSLVAADMPEPELSHGGDAVITTVDSVQIARVGEDASTVVLASGDTAGAVCLWRVNAATGVGMLSLPPYQVTSQARRICSLQLSPSGEHIAVGLFDRLLLLGISTPSAAADSGTPVLYVRTCLDMMAKISALYTVAFYPDVIRVWRITDEAHAPPVAGASHLTELDSFADQDTADPDTPTSSNMATATASNRLADRADLGSYSVDADMSDSPIQVNRLGLRTDSPDNLQSPNPPPPARPQTTTAEVTVAYGPGITITTWLHHNVDSLRDRQGLVFSNLNAEFSCHTDAAMMTTGTATGTSRLASVVDDAALTWLDIPTTESNCPDQAALLRSTSGNSANVSTYTADGTHCAPNPPPIAPLHASNTNTVDLQSQSMTSTEQNALTAPRFLEIDNEYIQLYAPHHPSEDIPLSPPLLQAPAPRGISPAERNTSFHAMLSEAIPGVVSEMSESAVSFQASTTSRTPSTVLPVVLQVRLPSVGPDTSEEAATVQEAHREGGLLGGAILDHRARHCTHYTNYGMVRPSRSQHQRRSPEYDNLKLMLAWFQHDSSECFLRVKTVLSILCACYQPPTVGIIAAAMEVPHAEVSRLIRTELNEILAVSSEDKRSIVTLNPAYIGLYKWLCSEDIQRVGAMFWLDAGVGHNLLCSLYLRYCGNKSVAVEHTWQDYLRTYGPTHLRHATRGLRLLTMNIRKIDETANIRVHLPRQIGYIVGLYEIYARRVGLRGRIPTELGQLRNLRVLSMGNNHLSGELPASLGELRNLQRIVLHQNNLRGPVPVSLGALGCIVNLAGNPLLHHGEDVPAGEKQALVDLYQSTHGAGWNTKNHWCSSQPVAKWYKVGVLTSHVHSIVMSSNNMEGTLPSSVNKLTYLRMIELATMPGLVGRLPKELCTLTTLRRLCICRCGLTGSIPPELGKLVGLEELQLFGNQLSGTVPSSLSNLTNLKLLSLGEYTGGNSFQPDTLPVCLASLVHLEALFMANCNIRGPLPDWIGNLTELRQLDLQRNQLSGPLPNTIGALQNLLYLNMKDNQHLTGRLPLPELLSLTKLNRLSLVHCNFLNTDHAQAVLNQHLPRCKVWI